MKNYIECRPVILPTQDIIEQPGLRKSRKMGILSIGTLQGSLGNIWESQHLYLVSDREIKEGDWDYLPSTGKIRKRHSLTYTYIPGERLVEATTDKSLGLPLIPQSFIEEYVQKQGKIDKVKIKLPETMGCGNYEVFEYLKTLPYEVIILPIKNSWNRENMQQAFEAGYEHGVDVNEHTYTLAETPDFDKWFDKTY